MPTRVLRVRGGRVGREALRAAVDIIHGGGVAVFPTDTVYGIGASVFRPHAIQRIYRIKGRSNKKPLPFLVSDVEQALSLVRPPDAKLRRLLNKYWPGPLTVVFATSPLGRWTTGGKETLAVRIPDCPVALALIKEVGAPLATTSANRSGRPDAVTGKAARQLFEGQADVILDGGACPKGVPSTVLDVSSTVWTLVREGAVSKKELLRYL